ncbi:hypothetical protein N8Z09_02730 [Methylophilaceae bacterium]|nr:hypothetical protein [Methylophilaceae bacterium]
MIKTLLVTLALFTTSAFADTSKVCLANQAGGLMVLTHETCKSDGLHTKLFPYHAYATESNGTIHTGCYDIPSIADAQKQPGTRIIPVVNFIDTVDGQIITLHAEWFSQEACELHTEI